MNCNEYHARKGDSCSLLQFMIRSVNSCNTVAIHCVFSVKDNTHTVLFSLFSTIFGYFSLNNGDAVGGGDQNLYLAVFKAALAYGYPAERKIVPGTCKVDFGDGKLIDPYG